MAEGDRINDREVWKRCNPAYPARISMDYLEREWAALGGNPEVFARERLGKSQWPADEAGLWQIVAEDMWQACYAEDVSLGGVLITAGEAVLPALVSANRDETVFAEADRLVIDRADNPHVAFGHGIHRCLGAQLARAELRLTLEALRERLPGLRLAVPAAEIPWQLGGMQRGPAELPVTW